MVLRPVLLVSFVLAFFAACTDLTPLERRLAALETRSELDLTRLQLKGKDGKVRASLYLDKDGQPVLDMLDKAGEKRLMLRLRDDESPTLVLWGRGHKGTAFLAIDEPGVPAMVFFDPNGEMLVDTRKNRPMRRQAPTRPASRPGAAPPQPGQAPPAPTAASPAPPAPPAAAPTPPRP